MKELIITKTNSKDLVSLLSGSLLVALAINLFIAPHNLAFGGVTGLTIIIKSLIGLPISTSNFILSAVIIILGWYALGREFLVKTIIPTMAIPFFLILTEPLSEFAPTLPVAAICGAIAMGLGISLTMLSGGSTAGPDTIGLILKDHFSIPITRTMLIIDISIILCGFHFYGLISAIWSVCVVTIMNLTIKLVRDIISQKIIFRYRNRYTRSPGSVSSKL